MTAEDRRRQSDSVLAAHEAEATRHAQTETQLGSAHQPRHRHASKPGRQHSYYSIVSALFAGTLAVTLLTDIIVGHSHINREISIISMFSFIAIALLPYAMGRRYPWWMGLCFITYLAFWSVLSLATSSHAHVELNVLLNAPIVAVYLGWFYPAWVARLGLSIYLCVMAVAVPLTSSGTRHEFSSELALLYALMIAWFCLETGMYLRRRARQESHMDALTGALNRRGLRSHGQQALVRARRKRQPLTIVAIDFDAFKSLNDQGGHAAGDAALSGSVSLWRSALDQRDLIARVGGDEFVLIIHAHLSEAVEQMNALSADAPYLWSWGASEIDADTTLDQALVTADGELYRAKARRQLR